MMQLPGEDTPSIVTVLGVKGNQVRIGIIVPRHVPVDREEIWERKQEEMRPKLADPDGNKA